MSQKRTYMRNLSELEVRKMIMVMAIGDSEAASVDRLEPNEARLRAIRFAKSKKLPIEVLVENGGIKINRQEQWPDDSIYPQLDALNIGESYLFKLHPAMHQRVRVAASSRNLRGFVLLTCSREGDFIRVTRLPITEAENAACGPIQAAPRASRWPMDGLASGEKLVFNVVPADQHKLRLAVSKKAKLTGWTIRARLQDDGTMLVYRTDAITAPQN